MSGTIATSTAVDLSRLPPPDVVEALDYETILADKKARLAAAIPEFDALLESDPAIKLLEICAFDELLLRQRVNDGARAVLLAYAIGADLDNIAALFGVTRRTILPADPQTGAAAILEADADLRRRVLLAPDSYSVAGPASAYVFHALSAHGDLRDAAATSPAPGEVVVSLLSRTGDGTAPPAVVEAVAAVLNDDGIRPLTDAVSVRSAGIVNFAIDARLTLYPGPDAQLILATANRALADLLASQKRIGRDITRSALFAALHVAGVQKVELVSPAADVVIGGTDAANAAPIAVTIAGVSE
ncbi:baseplate J/gp47 family protein [Pelagerythrobacter sp.]|uniref:baseplate assembly protein n=1 Tax=Pelagerythrobacter sp. TaxID=2800702 RepID=UPI0035AE1989